ncbi:hypothetical protein DevBK_02845 [Devosia sp. BK]|uniref:hypothetical protein n=1 Tax=unclassified Devosia TaxID=196773 RepID=UPI00071244F5|nr:MULTISPECIES: hypothetical protein [unclassified Devosia]KQN70007.1 hypothetical protein ASE94_13045 [Devosia sp. Leaf64]MDV3250266.1 hypothetical protein [Devosia sp. BK]
MSHLFKVGEMVDLRSAPRHSNRPNGPCEVIACLPHDSGPVQYRVKSRGESVERVVDEVDLSPSNATKATSTLAQSVFSIAVNKR